MRVLICAFRGRGGVSGEERTWHLVLEVGGECSNTITSVQLDNHVLELEET